jgi:excisionase family DNA binding protein
MSAQLFRVPSQDSKSEPAARKLPHFLRVEEVANLLRCKKRTIYDIVEQKRIPYRRVGGRLLFDLADIIEWTKRG